MEKKKKITVAQGSCEGLTLQHSINIIYIFNFKIPLKQRWWNRTATAVTVLY